MPSKQKKERGEKGAFVSKDKQYSLEQTVYEWQTHWSKYPGALRGWLDLGDEGEYVDAEGKEGSVRFRAGLE